MITFMGDDGTLPAIGMPWRPRRAPLILGILAISWALLMAPNARGDESISAIPSPSLVENGGMVGHGASAMVLYLDAELLLPPLTVGFRHGLFPWLELGIDVGAHKGLIQGLVHAKVRIYESPISRRFFLGARLRTGPKFHQLQLSEELIFDDLGWVLAGSVAVAVRFGSRRQAAIYLSSIFYAEVDLHTPTRQTDLFWVPASVGLEYLLGRGVSVFFELGPVWMINGTETADQVLYDGAWFPVGQLGVAVAIH